MRNYSWNCISWFLGFSDLIWKGMDCVTKQGLSLQEIWRLILIDTTINYIHTFNCQLLYTKLFCLCGMAFVMVVNMGMMSFLYIPFPVCRPATSWCASCSVVQSIVMQLSVYINQYGNIQDQYWKLQASQAHLTKAGVCLFYNLHKVSHTTTFLPSLYWLLLPLTQHQRHDQTVHPSPSSTVCSCQSA